MTSVRQQRELEEKRQRRQVAFNWWLCAASTAVMTYLMVSASDTFRVFSPIPSNHIVFYSASFVVCALQGWFSVNPVEGLVKVPVIVLVPPLIYGTARTILSTLLFNGGQAMMVMMASWVSQHLVLHILALAFLGCAGMVLGMLSAAYFVTWS